MTQPLEVIPFPVPLLAREAFEQLIDLFPDIALAPPGVGPGDVVEVTLEFGFVQGLLGLRQRLIGLRRGLCDVFHRCYR